MVGVALFSVMNTSTGVLFHSTKLYLKINFYVWTCTLVLNDKSIQYFDSY